MRLNLDGRRRGTVSNGRGGEAVYGGGEAGGAAAAASCWKAARGAPEPPAASASGGYLFISPAAECTSGLLLLISVKICGSYCQLHVSFFLSLKLVKCDVTLTKQIK